MDTVTPDGIGLVGPPSGMAIRGIRVRSLSGYFGCLGGAGVRQEDRPFLAAEPADDV
jgi:hypothetical protein